MEAFSKPEDVTEELYDQVFGLNTRAQFFVGQHALKYLSGESQIRFILGSSCPLRLTFLSSQMVAVSSSCHPSLPA